MNLMLNYVEHISGKDVIDKVYGLRTLEEKLRKCNRVLLYCSMRAPFMTFLHKILKMWNFPISKLYHHLEII